MKFTDKLDMKINPWLLVAGWDVLKVNDCIHIYNKEGKLIDKFAVGDGLLKSMNEIYDGPGIGNIISKYSMLSPEARMAIYRKNNGR